MLLSDILFVSIVIGVAFLPSILYMVRVRNTERYEREPWRAVVKSFVVGATFGVFIALILELIINVFYNSSLEFLRGYEFIAEHEGAITAIVMAVIVAPLVEEATKAYGILVSKDYIDEIEDGVVYGAASGFGFAALENLAYEVTALLTGGIWAWIAVSFIRSISSALLHGSATAMTGLGYSLKKMRGESSMLHGYGIAVLMHSSFNFIASIPIIMMGEVEVVYLFVIVLAVIYGKLAFTYIRKKIRMYDKPLRQQGRRQASRQ